MKNVENVAGTTRAGKCEGRVKGSSWLFASHRTSYLKGCPKPKGFTSQGDDTIWQRCWQGRAQREAVRGRQWFAAPPKGQRVLFSLRLCEREMGRIRVNAGQGHTRYVVPGTCQRNHAGQVGPGTDAVRQRVRLLVDFPFACSACIRLWLPRSNTSQ